MLLTGRLVDAERAYAVGALHARSPRTSTPPSTQLVDDVMAGSATTQRATKRQLTARAAEQEKAPAFDEQMLREVYTGDDFAEGVRAFLAKEKPKFATVVRDEE